MHVDGSLPVTFDRLRAGVGAPVVVPFPDAAEEVFDVIIGHCGHIGLVLRHEVLHRSRAPVAIEGPSTIGEQYECDTSAPQHAMDLAEHRERVREVFEHVARDHEVLALVVEGTQTLGVQIGDDVGHGKRRIAELGKELTVGIRHPSIDIPHVGARVRNGERGVPGTQLHTISDEIPREERTQGCAIQGLDGHHHPPEHSGGPPGHRGRWVRCFSPIRRNRGAGTGGASPPRSWGPDACARP